MAEDLELLERWSEGDTDAAEILLDRHVDAVARFFRGKVGPDVDDLVQETFTRCLSIRHTLRPGSNFSAYLFTVARNLLFARYRQLTRRAEIDPQQLSAAELAPSPSLAHRQSEERRILLDALRKIPLDSQIALELFYWENLSVADVARVLEIPEGTVKSRIHRARGQLRKSLEALAAGNERLVTTLSDLTTWAAEIKKSV